MKAPPTPEAVVGDVAEGCHPATEDGSYVVGEKGDCLPELITPDIGRPSTMPMDPGPPDIDRPCPCPLFDATAG